MTMESLTSRSGRRGSGRSLFNISRLELARRRRGLTKKGLAEASGVPERTLVHDLKSEGEPPRSRVRAYASALGFPLDFFYRDEVEKLSVEAVSFRALSRMTARQRDQEMGSAEIALELERWIEQRFELPHPQVPDYADSDAEVAAELVRRDFGLGERPVRNMVNLLEAHGVRVFSLAPESNNVDAFSFWRDGVPYVFLNTSKSAERSRMDAAHELGHLVLHATDKLSSRDREFAARRFGAAFLMPKSAVLAEVPYAAKVSQLRRAKHNWGVSLASLICRAHDLSLLSDWQYRSSMIDIGRCGYRTDEPDSMPRETSQVFGKVFKALRQQDVTLGHIAAELGLPSDELSNVVFGLTLTVLEGRQERSPAWGVEGIHVASEPSDTD